MRNFTQKIFTFFCFLMMVTGVSAQALDVTELTMVPLSKVNIEAQAYLSYSATQYSTRNGSSMCGVGEGEYPNMSGIAREITILAANVASFDLLVNNSTLGRLVEISINNSEYEQISHSGTACEVFSRNVDTNGNITLRIRGNNGSVYPLSITLHPAGDLPVSDDATLSVIKVDNNDISGFTPTQEAYEVELPYAFEGLPVVTAVTMNDKADALVTQIDAIPGSATIAVTAESGVTKSYSVHFTRASVATQSEIISFNIAGQKGATQINRETNIITVDMIEGTDLSVITPTIKVSPFATVDKVGPQDFTNAVVYTVTAEDGVSTTAYTVVLTSTPQAWLQVFPYTTDIPAEFEIPAWMSGSNNTLVFNGAYAGSDAGALGSDNNVLRVNANEIFTLHLAKCETIEVHLSATGGRTFNLLVDGEEKATTGSVLKDTKNVLEYTVGSSQPVVVGVQNIGTGGSTIGFIKITAPTETSIEHVAADKVVYSNGVIRNLQNIALSVYSVNGVRVATSTGDISMESIATGVYVVRGEGVSMKIIK